MGVATKAAGAAVTAAAPEAKAASMAARKITPGMSPKDVNGELQRRRKEAADRSAAKRSGAQTSGPPAASTPPLSADPGTTTPAAPAPTSSGVGLSVPGSVSAAAGTGGGFLLGLFGWALGLAYLRGGAPEVRRLLAAKFLNKV